MAAVTNQPRQQQRPSNGSGRSAFDMDNLLANNNLVQKPVLQMYPKQDTTPRGDHVTSSQTFQPVTTTIGYPATHQYQNLLLWAAMQQHHQQQQHQLASMLKISPPRQVQNLVPLVHAPITPPVDLATPEKRSRTVFSMTQLDELEKVFKQQQYVVGSERTELAYNLRLTEAQVKVWFQNRRIKERKQQKSSTILLPPSGDQKTNATLSNPIACSLQELSTPATNSSVSPGAGSLSSAISTVTNNPDDEAEEVDVI